MKKKNYRELKPSIRMIKGQEDKKIDQIQNNVILLFKEQKEYKKR